MIRGESPAGGRNDRDANRIIQDNHRPPPGKIIVGSGVKGRKILPASGGNPIRKTRQTPISPVRHKAKHPEKAVKVARKGWEVKERRNEMEGAEMRESGTTTKIPPRQ